MIFKFKNVEKKDWDLLLDWRNEPSTKMMSLVNKKISKKEHYNFFNSIISNKNIDQFIFVHNGYYVGTIKADNTKKSFTRLSYTINPDYRRKGYGSLMMSVFLFDRKGIFLCEIKESNIGSIKMCESNHFKLKSKKENILTYEKVIT